MATESEITEITGKQLAQQPQRTQYLSAFDEFDQWVDEIRRSWMQPFGFIECPDLSW
jgi:hypothetical protein